ncbi:PadR family transcriptional regulator [Kibdelosporangium phytohabitans]|uniref:Transcription regulator PadR N-terminal domain-containing protein n=1 Tax=Kibdelosporangium phytohabitans TaxID=860235 RepID=A0A0N9I0Q3_9PSEU|nr:helix-turn-helix transcriptional regulator [Kibdelosporangium phytohabitans]ALG09584.1 hypothetical protein AOZ06_24165 [Kibdelosporangium phytohabitans]MBE1469087.1 DNA-binding PadR family transcriptional regulator [Kibdelosporangium phytohabitans]
MSTPGRPSLLAFVLLGLLQEARMHPYEMQRLLKERRKDRVVNIKERSSFYQAIARLERDGLIAVHETVQAAPRPERTVYAITGQGRQAFQTWLRSMLSQPRETFGEFPVAISYLPLLEVSEGLRLLETRRAALAADAAEVKQKLAEGAAALPRLLLLEEELRQAVVTAELDWLSSLIDDIAAGGVTWSAESVAEQIRLLSPPTSDE